MSDGHVRDITIERGTSIYVRMIDSISSDQNQTGQTFRGSLDRPVRIGRRTILPDGADAYVKLLSARSAGQGRSELKLMLERIEVGDQSYTVASNLVEFRGRTEGEKPGRSARLGALFGGRVGALFGRGKEADIDASPGAGTGLATSAAKEGAEVRLRSGSLVHFQLSIRLRIRE